MSLIKQLAKETMIYGLSNVLNRLLNFLVLSIYLTWRFTQQEQDQYGTYNELYFYVGFLLIFLTFRMETTYFRFAKENESETFSVASILLIGSALVWTVFILLSAKEIAQLLHYSGKSSYISILGIVLSLDILAAIPLATYRYHNRPIRYALVKSSAVLVNVLLVLFFLSICPIWADKAWISIWYDPENKLNYVFLANLVGSSFALLLLLPVYFKSRWSFNFSYARRMIRYALPLIIVGICGVINQSGFSFFQKYFLIGEIFENLEVAGTYAAATKLALIMSLFTVAFNYAAEPFFFAKSEQKQAPQIYANVSLAYTIAACFLMLVVCLYIDNFQIILGPSFRNNVNLVPWMMLGYLLLGLFYNFSIWYKIKDKTYIGALISVGGAVVTFIVTATLIPKYGSIAMAWATLACYLFMAIASYISGSF